MAAKRGRKRRDPAINIQAVTGLTHEELHALRRDLETAQEARSWPLPLFQRLKLLVVQLEVQQHLPWDRAFVRQLRWNYVRIGRRVSSQLGGCEFQFAADVLKGTPAEAGWKQMKKDYETVGRTVFPEQRRPRIKRPQQRPADIPVTRDELIERERGYAKCVTGPAGLFQLINTRN